MLCVTHTSHSHTLHEYQYSYIHWPATRDGASRRPVTAHTRVSDSVTPGRHCQGTRSTATGEPERGRDTARH